MIDETIAKLRTEVETLRVGAAIDAERARNEIRRLQSHLDDKRVSEDVETLRAQRDAANAGWQAKAVEATALRERIFTILRTLGLPEGSTTADVVRAIDSLRAASVVPSRFIAVTSIRDGELIAMSAAEWAAHLAAEKAKTAAAEKRARDADAMFAEASASLVSRAAEVISERAYRCAAEMKINAVGRVLCDFNGPFDHFDLAALVRGLRNERDGGRRAAEELRRAVCNGDDHGHDVAVKIASETRRAFVEVQGIANAKARELVETKSALDACHRQLNIANDFAITRTVLGSEEAALRNVSRQLVERRDLNERNANGHADKRHQDYVACKSRADAYAMAVGIVENEMRAARVVQSADVLAVARDGAIHYGHRGGFEFDMSALDKSGTWNVRYRGYDESTMTAAARAFDAIAKNGARVRFHIEGAC